MLSTTSKYHPPPHTHIFTLTHTHSHLSLVSSFDQPSDIYDGEISWNGAGGLPVCTKPVITLIRNRNSTYILKEKEYFWQCNSTVDEIIFYAMQY